MDDTPLLISMVSRGGGIVIADNNAYFHRCHNASDSFASSSGNTIQQLLAWISAYSEQFDFNYDSEYLQKIPVMLNNCWDSIMLLKPELYQEYDKEKFLKLCEDEQIIPSFRRRPTKASINNKFITINNIENELKRSRLRKSLREFIFSVKTKMINHKKYKIVTLFGLILYKKEKVL